MASLALMVAIILLFIIFCGPFVWLVSFLKFLPNWFMWILIVPLFLVGFYSLFIMAIYPVSLIGLLPLIFGWMVIKRRKMLG